MASPDPATTNSPATISTINDDGKNVPSEATDYSPTGEKGSNHDVETGSAGLERTLHARHLQFIAIGGTIGTGLFIGTGSALHTSGPGSLLIAFLFIGSVVFSVMVALSEMAAYIPVAGSFTVYASRFVDPTLGFAMGWIYWLSWSITYALELTAAGLIIQYWDPTLNIGIWIGVFWLVFTAINFMPVRWFGEVEMWFSMIKVVTIVGFIIFAIVVNAGGVGHRGYLGFHYWNEPGAFVPAIEEGGIGKFIGFWMVLVTAGFSFQGTELVGMGAGETANPSKSIPSAIRWTFWSIFSLFAITILMIGITVPYDNKDLEIGTQNASASPLVICAKLSGVKVLPDIINAVLLTAVLTAGLANVYSSSRILIGLASEGHAPAIFKKTNRHSTPYVAVAFTSLFGLLGFLNLSKNGATVFTWLLNITAIAGFISWSLINVCHLRFMSVLKSRGIPRRTLPYIAPLQPYLSCYGLFFNVLIILTNGFAVFINWDTSGFFTAYISLVIFVVLYVGHKVVFRTKIVKLSEVDLDRGQADLAPE